MKNDVRRERILIFLVTGIVAALIGLLGVLAIIGIFELLAS